MALSENEGWNGGFVRDDDGRLVISDAGIINVKNFGAVGDGVADDTQAIQDAIDSIGSAAYRGDILVPRGKYRITDRIVIPYNVNLVGQGGSSGFGSQTAGTQFIAGHADAQLCFGQPDDNFGTLGGFSGHFSMDGDGVSDRNDGFMLVHRVVGRMFTGISVYDCAGDGLHIHQGQSCTFIGLDINTIAGDGITLDQGVSGHEFLRCETATCGGYHLKLVQTTGSNPYYAHNTANSFDACIFEYAYPYGAGTCQGVVRAESCEKIWFNNCGFSVGDGDTISDGSNAMIQVEPTGPDYAEIILNSCYVTSNNSGKNLIEQANAYAQVHLTGGNSLSGNSSATGWVYAGGTGSRTGSINWAAGIGTRYGGAGTSFDYNVPARISAPLLVEADTTKDGVLGRFYRSSETYPRATISIGGGLQIGNGSANPDVSIERITVNTIGPGSDDIFQIRGPLDIDSTTIGFFGATPAAKPTVTGSRGGNAALASLLTALATLGLITDSSS